MSISEGMRFRSVRPSMRLQAKRGHDDMQILFVWADTKTLPGWGTCLIANTPRDVGEVAVVQVMIVMMGSGDRFGGMAEPLGCLREIGKFTRIGRIRVIGISRESAQLGPSPRHGYSSNMSCSSSKRWYNGHGGQAQL